MRLIIVFAIVILSSCRPDHMTVDQMKAYSLDPDHGLAKATTERDVRLEVIYRPKDLVVAQQLTGRENTTEKERILKTVDSLEYFVFRISKNGNEIESQYASNESEFTEVSRHLAGYIGADFTLLHDHDTLPRVDAIYTPAFGAARATSILLVFRGQLQTLSGSIQMRFDDSRFHTGTHTFDFDLEQIHSTPRIKF